MSMHFIQQQQGFRLKFMLLLKNVGSVRLLEIYILFNKDALKWMLFF